MVERDTLRRSPTRGETDGPRLTNGDGGRRRGDLYGECPAVAHLERVTAGPLGGQDAGTQGDLSGRSVLRKDNLPRVPPGRMPQHDEHAAVRLQPQGQTGP